MSEGMSLETARQWLGKKTPGGVEFIGIVLPMEGSRRTLHRLECLCPCGTVWISSHAPGGRNKFRSCLACARKRTNRYMHLLARGQ